MTQANDEIASKAEREIELRLLERGLIADLKRHDGVSGPALVAAWDQYAVDERIEAGLYDETVQHIAGRTWKRMVAKGMFPDTSCGICAVLGWRSHE